MDSRRRCFYVDALGDTRPGWFHTFGTAVTDLEGAGEGVISVAIIECPEDGRVVYAAPDEVRFLTDKELTEEELGVWARL